MERNDMVYQTYLEILRRELKAPQYPKVEETGEDVIVLDHVSYHKESKHNGLNDVSLRIRRGEAVGIVGVDGNGQQVFRPHSGHV